MRKLASIRTIDKIVPHKNADRLEVAIIGGWPAVVGKDQYSEGDLVVFCEVDCLLPPRPEYDYLAKSCLHKEPDGSEWYRIKTMRLRKQLSQGLILPLYVLDEIYNGGTEGGWTEGTVVTDFLGIRKYEKPLSPQLSGTAKGPFPFFISKTDEERIQNLSTEEFYGLRFHRSEKLDGSSCTIYNNGGEIGVCSRNLELVHNPDNTFWKVADESGVLQALTVTNRPLAMQGEVVGPGIQGNRYKLDKHEFFAFNLFDITSGTYVKKDQFLDFCRAHNIQTVPVLNDDFCPESIEDILADAEGCSYLNTDVEREGVVWVNDKHGIRFSFKAISNKFLLKNDE